MSNFKQVNKKSTIGTPLETKASKAQERWLEGHFLHLQKVEKYNQLIKSIFICRKCGKRITNQHWVFKKDPHNPNDYSKLQYYHSRQQCNPHFIEVCLYCNKTFRKNQRNQKLCSKKCSVKYMTSPILLRRCSICGKEFKTRLIPNKQNNEFNCPQCR